MSSTLTRTLLLLAGAAVLVLVAWATGLLGQGDDAHATEQGSTEDHATMQDHESMADHAGMTYVPDEATFISGMIPHHQEAVDSANELLAITERPEVRALGEDIVRVQTEEIEQLEAWLAEWYPEQPPYDAYVPMMRGLAGLAPADADVTFVEDMIAHHEMAIAMAAAYLALPEPRRAEVEAVAQAIVDTQGDEIAMMHEWLEEWGVEDHGGH